MLFLRLQIPSCLRRFKMRTSWDLLMSDAFREIGRSTKELCTKDGLTPVVKHAVVIKDSVKYGHTGKNVYHAFCVCFFGLGDVGYVNNVNLQKAQKRILGKNR